MFNLNSKKRAIRITVKESPKEQRIWRYKYNRFMRSRQILVWAR
ncbi:MAG: hypothetical protein PHX76_02960 [Patescibacteria group bacterium]|jgi:hypothetical protein|nr:hypothetical protein [Patescibacteria group bacterium]MDD3939522.1 hypothetical protein [Patescibacteria group bacterium]MDD4443799.1 hypothetical protein [Patescibacteria group bacterium]